MKNTFGQSVMLTLFGESHGKAIGVVIDGLAPGIQIDNERIAAELTRRRPASAIDTARREEDKFDIVSGVFNSKTTGTPICIVIPNSDTKSSDYNYGKARPSHADYTAYMKYHGNEDYRGSGHFSGRLTAALSAAGGILLPALENIGIKIATRILSCAGVRDRALGDIDADIEYLHKSAFPTLDIECGEKIKEQIMLAKQDSDSVGGVTQTLISGVPAGVGEPFFDSAESLISHAVFGIGGIKGIEFGAGFAMSARRGSQCNDPFRIAGGKIVTSSNNSGGINGGITNGMPIVFQCAVKPTPSIAAEQKTVDFVKNEEIEYMIKGRHDPAIIRRVCPVLDSISAAVICDMLAQRYGTDVLVNGFSEKAGRES